MIYQDFYRESIDDPSKFWKTQSEKIDWFKKPEIILSKNDDDYFQWFEEHLITQVE